MSKRFIDTGLYDDEWFMNLSKDCKLLWIYFITKCDHAGILKLNEKLCKVQTDIRDLPGAIKELGNRLVTVSEHLYFIPKFIEFQYPGFPKSNVRQQVSAMDILDKYGLIKEGKLRLSKEFANSYDNDNDNDIEDDIENKEGGAGGGKRKELNIPFDVFWQMYDKKVDRGKCEPKWNRLSDKERSECMARLPEYVMATPDKRFRRDPETYLNNKSWENEIVTKSRNGKPKTELQQLYEETHLAKEIEELESKRLAAQEKFNHIS